MTNLHCHFGSFLSPRRVDREKTLFASFLASQLLLFWTHPPLTLLFSRPRLGGFGAPSSDPSLPLRTGSAVPARSCLRSALPRCPWQPGKSRSAGTAFPPTNTTHTLLVPLPQITRVAYAVFPRPSPPGSRSPHERASTLEADSDEHGTIICRLGPAIFRFVDYHHTRMDYGTLDRIGATRSSAL
jgi:hypothetical protein